MARKQTPLRPYFEKMTEIGKELSEAEVKRGTKNLEAVAKQEALITAEEMRVHDAGIPGERVRYRGSMTIYDRLDYMVDEGTWDAIGRPWMRLIHGFIRDWSPSLASIVALDQFTRLAMIELHRTERSTYAKISDAAKAIVTDAKWHRFETIAFQKFQSHDATKIVNFRNPTMAIPTTDSLIPAMMRTHAPGASPGGDLPGESIRTSVLDCQGWK